MSERLVVMFAYHFPPENAIGGARPFRFAKYLSKLGYTCKVITAAKQKDANYWDTEYVPDPFVVNSRWSLRWQLERAIRKVLLPSHIGFQWSYSAVRAARACIEAHPGAQVTILSSYPPFGTHLAAWQLTRGNIFPWIADFRDPFIDEMTPKRMNSLRKQVHQWFERSFFRRANAVIANTDSAKVAFQTKFPSFGKKVQAVWNGFDPDDRTLPLPILPRKYKLLSHVGTLYNGRNATPLLESILRLIAAGRLSADNVRLKLIGPLDDKSLLCPKTVQRAKSQGWLELITELVPQSQARRVAQTSDGLLLLQSESTSHVPAKLFEYLQIGRPILALVPPNSPAEQLMKRSGVPYRCIYPGSTSEVFDETVADFFSLPSAPVATNPWFEAKFNVVNQVQELDAMIRSLHTSRLGAGAITPSPDNEHEVPYIRWPRGSV